MTKNQCQPSNYIAGSTFVAWWFSPQRVSWQQSINLRSNNVEQQAARVKRVQQRHNSQN